jgi:hypothetical protein
VIQDANEEATVIVAMDKAHIRSMSSDEKLNILVDIAFANHKELSRQSNLLYGNGSEGLCDIVRTTKRALVWLWGIFCGISGVFFTILIYHLVKV